MFLIKPIALTLLLLMIITIAASGQERPLRSDAVRYLDFLRDEQIELDFQLRHGEISRPSYQRATDRISILRELVNGYGRDASLDHLPDLFVVPADEID